MNKGVYIYCNMHLTQDPLLFPLPSGFGLWNGVSNVVRQREGKERIRAFAFIALVFLRCSPFLFVLCEREKRIGAYILTIFASKEVPNVGGVGYSQCTN
jgi:hypothetical protein